jgi:hypothetical protein
MTVDNDEILDNFQDSIQACFQYLKELPKKTFSYSFKSEEIPIKLKDIVL